MERERIIRHDAHKLFEKTSTLQRRKNSTKLISNCTSRVLLAVSALSCYLQAVSCPHTEAEALKKKEKKKKESRVGDTEYPEGLKSNISDKNGQKANSCSIYQVFNTCQVFLFPCPFIRKEELRFLNCVPFTGYVEQESSGNVSNRHGVHLRKILKLHSAQWF